MLLYDKIDIAICCNENSTDWELHDLIIASNGRIVDVLMSGIREKTRANQNAPQDEFNLYAEEINYLIQRINSHPTSLKRDQPEAAPIEH